MGRGNVTGCSPLREADSPMAMTKIIATALAATFTAAAAVAQNGTWTGDFALLHADDYQHYVIQFAADEVEATGKQPEDEWPWITANVPLFDSSDKHFEEMYYFR